MKINYETKEIILTKDEMARAKYIYSCEFNKVVELKKIFPDYDIVRRRRCISAQG